MYIYIRGVYLHIISITYSGFKKKQYIYHSKSREMVAIMKSLKMSLDPRGILNPYKYLPDD